MFPLPLDNLRQVAFDDSKEEPVNSGPTFFRCALLAVVIWPCKLCFVAGCLDCDNYF